MSNKMKKPSEFASTWMNRKVSKSGRVYYIPPVSTTPVKVYTPEERKALQEQLLKDRK